MLKLLQINTFLNSKSTGHIVEGIGKQAKCRNWKSYAAYGRDYNESSLICYKIGSVINVYTHAFCSRIFDCEGLLSVFATIKLIKFIHHIKPNIIHIHNIHGHYLCYPILFYYLNRIKTPVVWTLHDCWAFTGHCPHYDYVGCLRWQNGCHGCMQTSRYPKSFLDFSKLNWLLKKKCFTSLQKLTIVTVSSWLENQVRLSFLKNKRTCAINNGIDVDIFKPCPVGCLEFNNSPFAGKMVLIAVATDWSSYKGLYDYYRLSELLDEKYMILLVGLTKKQIASLPSNMFGIERTENVQELVKYYNLAQICLNLSYEESFGMTIVEAMACGTPCVSYNTTASKELIDEKTGLCVNLHDYASLVDSIHTIIKKGKKNYSEECRKKATTNYNKYTMYDKYVDLYSQLIKE